MAKVLSEAVGISMAPAVLGTTPTSGWTKLQPDKGSIQNWKKQLEIVERNTHSKNMTREKGDVVGYKVTPSFAHDFNKDYADLHAAPAFRCVPRHPGGGGQRVMRVTAAVDGGAGDDSFSHAALSAALPVGTLIYVRGMTSPANNGLFVVVAGSTTTSTKVATGLLVAEAAPPANATLDVAGFQAAAAGDVQMNAAGNLISTTTNFTNWAIPQDSRIVIGSGVLGTSANSFATRKCNAIAYVKSTPTATLIELYDHILELEANTLWTPAADTGTGKTIRVFFGSFYRNWAIDNANYAEPLLYGEKEDARAGADGTARYTDCKFLAVNTLAIAAPLKSKITATASYVGTDATDPVAAASRTGGVGTVAGDSPAQAYSPLATALVDTANDLEVVRMFDATGTLVGEINSWTLTLNNGVSPKEVQGTLGAIDHEWGEFAHTLQVEAYYNNSAVLTAASTNADLKWDVFVANHQYGFSFSLPRVAIREDQLGYEANKQVKLTFNTPAFRNEDTGICGALTIFGYVPPRS